MAAESKKCRWQSATPSNRRNSSKRREEDAKNPCWIRCDKAEFSHRLLQKLKVNNESNTTWVGGRRRSAVGEPMWTLEIDVLLSPKSSWGQQQKHEEDSEISKEYPCVSENKPRCRIKVIMTFRYFTRCFAVAFNENEVQIADLKLLTPTTKTRRTLANPKGWYLSVNTSRVLDTEVTNIPCFVIQILTHCKL